MTEFIVEVLWVLIYPVASGGFVIAGLLGRKLYQAILLSCIWGVTLELLVYFDLNIRFPSYIHDHYLPASMTAAVLVASATYGVKYLFKSKVSRSNRLAS